MPADPEYSTSSFTHDGHRIVYDVYEGDGPLLVYMHGLLIDSGINRGVAHALSSRGHRVVLVDLLGHGRSDKPTHASQYRIDKYVPQVVGLLDHLGADRAVVGGMSLGANVSLFAATSVPERIQGLVIEMPVLEWAVPSAAMLFVPMLLFAHYAGRPADLLSRVAGRIPSMRSTALDSLVHGASLPPQSMAALLHGILVGPVAPTHEARAAIEAPTLVLGHRNDLLHPFDDAIRLASQMPNATFVPTRSPFELRARPRRLTEVIGEFLDGANGQGEPAPRLDPSLLIEDPELSRGG